MSALSAENREDPLNLLEGHSGTSPTHSQAAGPPLPGLRAGRAADRPAILDLWVLAWSAVLPGIDFAARRPWLADHLDALAGGGARMLVADRDGRPAGFVTVDPARGHLDQLAVHPAHQGSGIADLLMAGAKALSPEGLHLDVNAANARARRFYARHGFVPVSEGVNPRSGLPTLLLRWRIAGWASGAGDEI